MTGETHYEYTDRNLVEEPKSYEYSEVRGRPFIDAYLENRVAALHEFERCIDSKPKSEHPKWSGVLTALAGVSSDTYDLPLPELEDHPAISPSLSANEGRVPFEWTYPVRTTTVLCHLLGYPGAVSPAGQEGTEWLDTLVSQFEVEKCLFTEYDANMQAVEDEPANHVVYPMLAIVLLIANRRRDTLKYLNTALKLSDLLVSLPVDDIDGAALELTALAINAEREIVVSLGRDRGVSL